MLIESSHKQAGPLRIMNCLPRAHLLAFPILSCATLDVDVARRYRFDYLSGCIADCGTVKGMARPHDPGVFAEGCLARVLRRVEAHLGQGEQ